MTDPENPTPDTEPPGRECGKCGKVHDPTRCKAHSQALGWQQCDKPHLPEQMVCQAHGGRVHRTHADPPLPKAAEWEARRGERLGKLHFEPVKDPLLELQKLAGEAIAWKKLLAKHVAHLRSLRYGIEAGEAIRGEVQLFERALNQCTNLLVQIAKLNIDERLVAIEERRRDMILEAIEAGLARAGVTGVLAVEARLATAAHLRVVSALPAA